MNTKSDLWEDYEDDFLDDDEVSFTKLSRKTKIVRDNKKAAIRQKRKEKLHNQEFYEKQSNIYINEEEE